MITLLLALSVFFSPHGGCTTAIVHEIGRAKVSVQVQAYAFTSQPIAQALLAAKGRGVSVQVILDRSWATASGKVEAELVAAGIPVLIDAKHAIAHNKVIVLDGRTVVTGSFNFTGQAETSNAENIVVIAHPKVAAIYAGNWAAHAAHSAPPP